MILTKNQEHLEYSCKLCNRFCIERSQHVSDIGNFKEFTFGDQDGVRRYLEQNLRSFKLSEPNNLFSFVDLNPYTPPVGPPRLPVVKDYTLFTSVLAILSTSRTIQRLMKNQAIFAAMKQFSNAQKVLIEKSISFNKFNHSNSGLSNYDTSVVIFYQAFSCMKRMQEESRQSPEAKWELYRLIGILNSKISFKNENKFTKDALKGVLSLEEFFNSQGKFEPVAGKSNPNRFLDDLNLEVSLPKESKGRGESYELENISGSIEGESSKLEVSMVKSRSKGKSINVQNANDAVENIRKLFSQPTSLNPSPRQINNFYHLQEFEIMIHQKYQLSKPAGNDSDSIGLANQKSNHNQAFGQMNAIKNGHEIINFNQKPIANGNSEDILLSKNLISEDNKIFNNNDYLNKGALEYARESPKTESRATANLYCGKASACEEKMSPDKERTNKSSTPDKNGVSEAENTGKISWIKIKKSFVNYEEKTLNFSIDGGEYYRITVGSGCSFDDFNFWRIKKMVDKKLKNPFRNYGFVAVDGQSLEVIDLGKGIKDYFESWIYIVEKIDSTPDEFSKILWFSLKGWKHSIKAMFSVSQFSTVISNKQHILGKLKRISNLFVLRHLDGTISNHLGSNGKDLQIYGEDFFINEEEIEKLQINFLSDSQEKGIDISEIVYFVPSGLESRKEAGFAQVDGEEGGRNASGVLKDNVSSNSIQEARFSFFGEKEKRVNESLEDEFHIDSFLWNYLKRNNIHEILSMSFEEPQLLVIDLEGCNDDLKHAFLSHLKSSILLSNSANSKLNVYPVGYNPASFRKYFHLLGMIRNQGDMHEAFGYNNDSHEEIITTKADGNWHSAYGGKLEDGIRKISGFNQLIYELRSFGLSSTKKAKNNNKI